MSDPLDELFQDSDVISASDFADYCGIAYQSALVLCANHDVSRLGSSYAITRDAAEEMTETLDQALEQAEEGAEDPDSEGDEDPDHDPDDPDCDCSDCTEEEADD